MVELIDMEACIYVAEESLNFFHVVFVAVLDAFVSNYYPEAHF